MKKLLLAMLLVGTVGLTGCSPQSFLGPSLILVTNEPLAVADATPRKIGRACGLNNLSLIAFGDMSTETARRKAGITKIAEVDRSINHFVVFSQVCTVVTGE